MDKKILLIPLDERPCNYEFPALMPLGECSLISPPPAILGDKKKPADFDELRTWILQNLSGAYGIILSMDMLLYGGIVPSRLHMLTSEQIYKRIDFVELIKTVATGIKIFAFQLIMRCPWYSSSDEEPDYYEYCGSDIHNYGKYTHLEKLGKLTDEGRAAFADATAKIPPADLADYLLRREKNINALLYTLGKVKSGTIDYFIVPQDDSAVHGFTSLDQARVRDFVKQNGLHFKAFMYPGADEAGMTLLSRFVCQAHGKEPKIFVHYASSRGGSVVPSFEDRAVDETVKYQIMAAGGMRVYSLSEADILLAVNVGGAMDVSEQERAFAYDVNRNLPELITQIKYALEQGKAVAVADIAHCNFGDIELVGLMQSEGLLYRINSYAGWNTSSNTLGTAICQCVATLYESGCAQKNERMLTHRYLEDVCYCGYVRKKITDGVLPDMGLNYFDAGGSDGAVAAIVKNEILDYCRLTLPEVYSRVAGLAVCMPWRRMFEVRLDVQIQEKSCPDKETL